MNKALLAAVALGLATVGGWADQKIAVINLKTVFDGYYKTKESDQLVKDRQAEYEKERKKMDEDYKKASEDYRKKAESAADPAVSADEKDKRKKDAESKLQEVKEIEGSFRTFEQSFRSQITDQIKRMREKILGEIKEVINSKAKAGGYTLVLDIAAESISQTPIVIYSTGSPDITDEVKTELNRTAPAGGAATEEKKDAPDAKEPKK